MAFAHRRGRPAEKRGAGALGSIRWLRKSKFDIMREFLDEIEDPPAPRDAVVVRRRFLAAARHAKRVLAARLVVTLLLAAGVLATAAASVARFLPVPAIFAADVAAWLFVLDRTAAISGSVAVGLVVLRLGFDRYLGLVETCCTFLAIEFAAMRARVS